MTLNAVAANNFYQAILQQYDKSFETPDLDQEGKVDPLAVKTQEYNQATSMTEWYKAVHAFEPYKRGDISSSWEQKFLRISIVQFSALDRLTAIKADSWEEGEEASYMLTDLVRSNLSVLLQAAPYIPLPVLSFSSPKSELDSWVFEKAFCALPDRERDQVVQYMEQACQNLKPHFFKSQQRIYRIQEIVTFIFRNSLVKGLICTGLIAGSVIFILVVAPPKIQAIFTKVLTQQWEELEGQYPNSLVTSGLGAIYHQARALNNFMTNTSFKAHVTPLVLPRLISMTDRISSYAPSILMKVYYVVYPKAFFGMCASKFVSSFLLKPSLIAFKILNGTEYKTVQALKEHFKKDPLACENALKAHALWMYLQQRGNPEASLRLLGYFPAPAA